LRYARLVSADFVYLLRRLVVRGRRAMGAAPESEPRKNVNLRASVFDSLGATPERFLQLFDTCAAQLTFDQSRPWLECFERHLIGPGQAPRYLCLENEATGEAVALLPLRWSDAGPAWYARRVVSGMSNYYTTIFGPVVAREADPAAVADRLVAALLELLPPWQTLDFCPMALEEPWFRQIVRALRARGCFVRPYFKFGNWILNVAGQSFAEYFKERPSKVQSTLKRKVKKAQGMKEVEVRIVTDPADVERTMDDYDVIYVKSWKGGEAYPRFIREVAHEFARQGWLRLGLVRVAGKPAASQLWFVRNGVANVYKLAYDPQFRELSPGSILTMKLFEHTIDVDKVRVIDYLAGDDDYKRDWMKERRERWGLLAARPMSAAGLLEGTRYALRGAVKPGLARAERAKLRQIGI
jgi:hypothetical protein